MKFDGFQQVPKSMVPHFDPDLEKVTDFCRFYFEGGDLRLHFAIEMSTKGYGARQGDLEAALIEILNHMAETGAFKLIREKRQEDRDASNFKSWEHEIANSTPKEHMN